VGRSAGTCLLLFAVLIDGLCRDLDILSGCNARLIFVSATRRSGRWLALLVDWVRQSKAGQEAERQHGHHVVLRSPYLARTPEPGAVVPLEHAVPVSLASSYSVPNLYFTRSDGFDHMRAKGRSLKQPFPESAL